MFVHFDLSLDSVAKYFTNKSLHLYSPFEPDALNDRFLEYDVLHFPVHKPEQSDPSLGIAGVGFEH